MARVKGENKQKRLAREVAKAVGAGVPWHLETVDFSDPDRPKTCLEVDFPILPINHIAAIEGNAGKPIYQMSKWWARRRSSVFRSMLIAAATKAPDDPAEAAKLVWDAYYGNHQKNEAFRKLKVADIFMGGGTTIVEGARLGMQMYGNDLNPVAWFVVKNELAHVDPKAVQRLLDNIEAEVKPQIMPLYACDCPRGHKGRWMHKATGKVMGPDFDPLALRPEARSHYDYDGPEILHTFWSKHGPCQASGCQHRTPIMPTPVLAVKTLSVRAWIGVECTKCAGLFDLEAQAPRMAPGALFVVSPDESPFAEQDENGFFACPHCQYRSTKIITGKPKTKSVDLTLLIHPDWLKGSPSKSKEGQPHGGSTRDTYYQTTLWNAERAKNLKLIEVRGKLPETVTCPDTREAFYTDDRGGTIPKQARFQCKQETCGLSQEIVLSIKQSGKSGPIAASVNQGYCPRCAMEGRPYDGRFFQVPDWRQLSAAVQEWETRSAGDLTKYWPRGAIPFGYMSPIQNDLPSHGMPNWSDLFNPRQLLSHAHLLRQLAKTETPDLKHYVLGAFQQYVKNQCMLAFWHRSHDHFAPALSERNYHPKTTSIEVGVFTPVGYGSWNSTTGALLETCEWKRNPWELVSTEFLRSQDPDACNGASSKSLKTYPGDPPAGTCRLECSSSHSLETVGTGTFDLVITDPPFGGLIHYSELADFFHVWLRLVLSSDFPSLFTSETTPKALEAVSNKVRHPEDSEAYYQKVLTQCWREAWRILKPGGLLAFTFHHSEDEPWVAVLESLFDAGFYLEATYPIRSDEIKGDGQFGSKQLEFDMIHVCRKRMDEPQPISWARLRRMILQDVRQLKQLLEQHHESGLPEADLQVIRRGKALEYYSRHYGKVYVERGREFPVKDALLAINQMLDEETDATSEPPPAGAEAYTRRFFRLFADRASLPRDQMQKSLRWTGTSPQEFVNRGWCEDKQKVFYGVSPLVWARAWKGVSRSAMSRDFDQAMFMIGACYEGSGIKLSDTLNNPRFDPHPATGDLIDWLVRHGGDPNIKAAAHTARQLFQTWLSKEENQDKLRQQQLQFGFDDVGE